MHKKVNINFFKEWSNEMAYVLGFFAADGYMTLNKRGGQYWCIQITDKELLYSIKEAVKAEHKISTKVSRRSAESTIYRLQIGSKEMCNDLRKLGFTERKTKSLAIPSVPKKYFSDFVSGYFDGDGNIWMGRIHKGRKTTHLVLKLTFTSCSYNFVKRLHDELCLVCLRGGCIYTSKNRQFYRLQFSTLNSLKLYDFMYNRGADDLFGLFLERKKSVFEKFIRLRP